MEPEELIREEWTQLRDSTGRGEKRRYKRAEKEQTEEGRNVDKDETKENHR